MPNLFHVNGQHAIKALALHVGQHRCDDPVIKQNANPHFSKFAFPVIWQMTNSMHQTTVSFFKLRLKTNSINSNCSMMDFAIECGVWTLCNCVDSAPQHWILSTFGTIEHLEFVINWREFNSNFQLPHSKWIDSNNEIGGRYLKFTNFSFVWIVNSELTHIFVLNMDTSGVTCFLKLWTNI